MKIIETVIKFLDSEGTARAGLNFGRAKQILVRRNSSTVVFRRNYFEAVSTSSFLWTNRNVNVVVSLEKEPNPHVIIVGMSGFGKSSLLRSLLLDIKNSGRSAIVFDAHDEHSRLVSSFGGVAYDAEFQGINIFALDGSTISERISDLTGLLKSVYSLGHVQATKLSDCLWYTYRKCGASSKYDKTVNKTPTIADLISELSVFIMNSDTAGEKNSLIHLRGRLMLLNTGSFSRGFVSVDGLKDRVSCFSLAGLKSNEAQIIYISELLRRIYAVMKTYRKEAGVSLYVVLDEAQFLIRSSESGNDIITKLIGEGRKYGVGVIIATHNASALDKRIISNAATFVSFYAREPYEVNYVANVFAGGNPEMVYAIKNKLKRLEQNEAVFMSGLYREPLLVKTPSFMDLKANYDNVDDNLIVQRILAEARKPVLQERLVSLFGLEADYTVNKLVGEGVLDRFAIDAGDKQEVWIMKHSAAVSVEHEVCVRKIYSFVQALDVKTYILDNSTGPDVVVLGKRGKLAVEYETGKKSASETKKMIDLRKGGFVSVIFMVNKSSYETYKQNFESDFVSVLKFGDYETLSRLIQT